MAHNIQIESHIACVKTAGEVVLKERLKIVGELLEIEETGRLDSIIVDHRQAHIRSTPKEYLYFGHFLSRLKPKNSKIRIYIIPPKTNMRTVVLPIMIAKAKSNLNIKMIKDHSQMDKATLNIFERMESLQVAGESIRLMQ